MGRLIFALALGLAVGATIVAGAAMIPIANRDGFNDPDFPTIQWGLHNTGQNGGIYDIDIDAPAAWSITTGSMRTVLAEIDDGVDYTHPDVYLNIWLNQGEIPAAIAANLTDTDGDGLITFRDLNAPANAAQVSDLNGNGYIDGRDLLQDPRWADGIDGDGNGKTDDLVGWDFLDNDNDPMPAPGVGHGTGMAQWIGGIPNNGVGKLGVNWFISIMPIRVVPLTPGELDPQVGAAALDYAVAEGAPIAALWGTNTAYSQTMYDAIDRARLAGQLVVCSARNNYSDNDVTPAYPGSYDLDNIIAATSHNANDGMDAAWNWGLTSVDLAGPTAPGGTSGACAHVAGVAALLKTIHPAWNYSQIKNRILSTVEPSAALAGKCVTGGRLNAEAALADTSIHVSDPTVAEGNSGTSQVTFVVSRVGDVLGGAVVNWATADGTAIAGTDYIAASGQLVFGPQVTSLTIDVSIVGDSVYETNENFFVNLSTTTTGLLMADEQAQATITDTDPLPTKFYVVDAGSPSRTYEYDMSGAAVENYALNSGNANPRGAASNAAGDTVWVVDANKKVYIYDTIGGLLGSWTAGSLAANATVEGIATNGSDVWIVDNKSDKAFRYTNGASRTSGSQNANSNFNLRSGNNSPKGIVTDGTHLWVVNDAATDKVFKYTLAGAHVSTFTISTAGASSPTGITLDPSNPQDLWIVDSGAARVYQYSNAVNQANGSTKSADASVPLAAGNTNPQGIADPPAPPPRPLKRLPRRSS